MLHAHVADGANTNCRVEVITVFYPVYHPSDLDKITCLLDKNGAGFTVTEGSSAHFLNCPKIMEQVHIEEHGTDFLNLATAHMVQLTDIC